MHLRVVLVICICILGFSSSFSNISPNQSQESISPSLTLHSQYVHIPGIFNMSLRKGGIQNITNLALDILFGAIKVDINRRAGPRGEREGPISISVLGIPIYKKF